MARVDRRRRRHPRGRDRTRDLKRLEIELCAHADRPLKIGSFSAASNVTGVLTDTDVVAELLHAHGALSFWDYAAAGPYVPIGVAPSASRPLAYKGAVFLSPHKFVGGPQQRGPRRPARAGRQPRPDGPRRRHGVVRLCERAPLLDRPGGSGGGRHSGDRRVDPRGARRQAQTGGGNRSDPASRSGSGSGGCTTTPSSRSSTTCSGSRPERGSCAGPYGHRLLGIDAERSHAIEEEVQVGCEGIKPGWTRVNLNYFIIDSVLLLARSGWKLLSDYRFEPVS